MIKMFETQLSGLLQKVGEQETVIEDSARITAQSILSDGQVYIAASADVGGVVAQAVHGADPIPGCDRLTEKTVLSSLDTVWIFTSSFTEVTEEYEQAVNAGASIVMVLPEADQEKDNIFFIDTHVKRPLLPTESGKRIGEPHLLVSLHIYYMLYFHVLEMLEEHNA